MLRKPPAKRAFSGMVGLPHEPEIVAEPVSVTTPDVLVQARQTVDALWDAARSVTEEYAPDRDRQVKNAVRDAFSPKRGPGRPRTPGKAYATEAERKKVEYAAARAKLVLALDAFDVTVDTAITPELQIKYATTAKTYGQLLRNDPKTLKKIIELLQQESGVVKRRSTTGSVMREAPRGKGKIVTGDYNSTKIDTDQGVHSEEQARLSAAPQDAELYGPDSPDSNSILNNTVVLIDGSRSNSDRRMHLPTGGSDNRFDNANTKETDFTFTNKARWPQSWFTAKYKPEYHEVADECMRQAVNAFSQAKNSEPGFEPGGGTIEISAQYCVLCDDKLSGRFSTIDHFLKTHLAQVQGFFRQAGVQFRRKHFGITEKT